MENTNNSSAQKQSSGGGCLGWLIKLFIAIGVVAVICSMCDSSGGDSGTDSTRGNSSDDRGSYSDSNYNSGNSGNSDYQSGGSSSEYVLSSTGYLVCNQLEPYTYPLSDVSTLSGFFRLSGSNLVCFPDCGPAHYTYNDTTLNLMKAATLPIRVSRAAGEQLVVVGGEWSGRSENEKRSMTLNIWPASFVGYSNSYMFEDLDLDEIDSVNGISIAAVNQDYTQVNSLLQGSGICCVYQDNKDRFARHTYLVSDQYGATVSCGFYEGTEYITTSISLTHPFVTIDEANPITLSVQSTTNGYFLVDISSLPAGLYVLDALNGNDLLVIE